MATTASEMVTAAKAAIENLTTEQVAAELADNHVVLVDLREPTEQVAAELADNDVVLVDLREPTETDKGVIPGAVKAPRGMLEFHADPTTPYHLDELDPGRRTILYCASGGRSALAVGTLQALGYTDVAHLEDGFNTWVEEDRPVTRQG